MRFNPTTFKSLLHVVAVVTLIQSFCWIVLTLLALLAYRCVLSAPSYAGDGVTATTFVKLYFEGSNCKIADSSPEYSDLENLSLIKPDKVNSWIIAYLVISIIQFGLTNYLFYCRNYADELLKIIVRLWCFVSFMVLLMDLVLFIGFFRDYIQIKDHQELSIKDVRFVPFIMSVLAGKGFVLWLFNFIACFYLFLWCTCSKSRERVGEAQQKPGHGLNYTASYDNYNYRDSPEPSSKWRMHGGGRAREVELRGQRCRRQQSLDSFEVVTHFNLEEYPTVLPRAKDAAVGCEEKGFDAYDRGCYSRNSDADVEENLSRIYPAGCPCHCRNCLKLKSELEEKLESLKTSKERLILNPRNLLDFSNDLKNFEQGRGCAKQPEQQSGLPSALSCEETMFY